MILRIKKEWRDKIIHEAGLLNKVCQISGRAPSTVIAWCYSNSEHLTQKGVCLAISKFLNVKENDLFENEID